MQFKTITISAFIGLAAATSSTDVSDLTNQLPSCSLLCIVSGATAAGCGATDYTCQCDSEATIISESTTCLKTSCSASDIGTTKNVTSQICDAITGGTASSSSSSTSKTASNSTVISNTSSSSTSTSTSSAASSSSTGDSSAGSRPELYGLGLAVMAGLTGLTVLV